MAEAGRPGSAGACETPVTRSPGEGPSWSGHWQVTDEIATFTTFSDPDTERLGELGTWVNTFKRVSAPRVSFKIF